MNGKSKGTLQTGLVLEGGGVRGIYTAGVLDRLMDEGMTFDGVIGVSAGAIHGCSFLSGQKGRSIRYYKKYGKDPRFMGMRSFLKTGNVVGVDFCYHELPDKLDVYDHESFLQNQTPFFVVCTNVESGDAEYIRLTDMRKEIDYLRASASLPYFSRIVEIDGKKYLDGGCADSIPVKAFMQMGFGRNLVVLTREEGYRKKAELKTLSLLYRKYPAFREKLLHRHEIYNDQVGQAEELMRQGSAFIIRPSVPLVIGRLEKDPDKMQAVYDIGYADCSAQIKRLQKWLS